MPAIPWFDGYEGERGLPYTQISRETPISFVRLMEANLDFGHFYFVHRLFSPPTLGPIAAAFGCEIRGDLIEVTGNLRKEGLVSAKNQGFPIYGAVKFPGLASYDTPKRERSIIACAPVDEKHSWFVARVFLPPGKPKWVAWFSAWVFTRIVFPILHRQDLRVMTAQDPPESGLETDWLAAKADSGIAAYHQLWRKNQREEKPAQTNPFRDNFTSPAP
ncbi:MAG: hypothetical protein AB7P04_13200 [Bacteriovoracia bacterium]